MRVSSFLSGGLLAPEVRGRKTEEHMHVADVYATLAELAGQPAFDTRAAAAGLPPVDSISMARFIRNPDATSNRTEIPLATPSLKWGNLATAPDGPRASEWSYMYNSAGALIVGDFKLIVGVNPIDVWTEEQSPNNTVPPPDGNGWPDSVTNCGNADPR